MSPVNYVMSYVRNMIFPDTGRVPPIFGIIISNNNTAITTHRVKSNFLELRHETNSQTNILTLVGWQRDYKYINCLRNRTIILTQNELYLYILHNM